MQENINEKISLLLDDELNSAQALNLLKTIQADDELKHRLQRYQCIGQVLKNEPCHHLDSHFTDKIHQQIRDEPTFFLPSRKAGSKWRKAGLAVAASIVLAVFWMVNKMDKQANPYQEPQIASIQPRQLNQTNEMSEHFNDYLQAHDNSVYINSVTRAQPYARVVGYQQE